MKAKDVVKRLLGSRLLRWVAVVLVIGVGGYYLSEDWRQVSHSLGKIGTLAAFEALLATFAMQFANLKVWQVLLAGLGSPLRTPVAGRILLIGQLGKYLPGTVWPILAQMELGAAAKVPRTRSASTSVLAMLISLWAGLVTALVTLPFAGHSSDYLWIFLLLPVLAVGMHPKVLNPLLNKLFKLVKRSPLETPVTGRVLTVALAWQFIGWIFYGLQIWILVEKFGAPPGRAALLALGGFAFAWCVGFVIVFLPAGAGFRDVLLIATLAPLIGTAPGTAVALASRAVIMINDLTVAGVAAFRRPRIATREPSQGAEDASASDPVPSS